jgi:hypothetical protein
MKKDDTSDDKMKKEYDFTGGIRGKYADSYAKGTNIVVIDPDLQDVFPDSESVNSALRPLAELIRSRARAAAQE